MRRGKAEKEAIRKRSLFASPEWTLLVSLGHWRIFLGTLGRHGCLH